MKNILLYATVLSLLFSCKKEKQYKENEVDYEAVFTISTSSTTNVRADNYSLIKIILESKDTVITDNLKVLFSTSQGSLYDTEKTFDTNDSAYTYLKVSQDTTSYIVTVTVKNGDKQIYLQRKRFKVMQAKADSIYLEANASTYKLNGTYTLKTFLNRNNGKTSINLPVEYSAVQTNSLNNQIKVGRFEGIYNNLSTTTGTLADLKFFTDAPGIDTTKTISIKAKTLNDAGQYVVREIILPYKR